MQTQVGTEYRLPLPNTGEGTSVCKIDSRNWLWNEHSGTHSVVLVTMDFVSRRSLSSVPLSRVGEEADTRYLPVSASDPLIEASL